MTNPKKESARPMRGSGASLNVLQNGLIISQFRGAMQSAGINFDGQIIADGRKHRFYIVGHKRGSKNGEYCLHLDSPPNGWFKCYRDGIYQTWKPTGHYRQQTPEEIAHIAESKREREAENLRERAEIAEKAQSIWDRARPITDQSEHPYLVSKQVQPHGSRLFWQALVIPVRNESDHIVNLQFINPPDGRKNFLEGGLVQGCFYTLGSPTSRILICEGFATGASLHEVSGKFVVVAFNAGNLLPVAKNIRAQYPHAEIILCGDNDFSGTGQAKAYEAAAAIAGKIYLPKTIGFDWNDAIRGKRYATK